MSDLGVCLFNVVEGDNGTDAHDQLAVLVHNLQFHRRANIAVGGVDDEGGHDSTGISRTDGAVALHRLASVGNLLGQCQVDGDNSQVGPQGTGQLLGIVAAGNFAGQFDGDSVVDVAAGLIAALNIDPVGQGTTGLAYDL